MSSIAIGIGGRGGMNRGLIARMVSIIAASAPGGNVLEIKPAPGREPLSLPTAKLAGMSPRGIARYRKNCGRPKKRKNTHHCARLAKVKRRRA